VHKASTPATTRAVWEPDTAVRWVRLVARMAAASRSGSSRVSPITNPTSRPPTDSGVRAVAAVRMRSRTRSLERASTPGSPMRSRVTVSSSARTWRRVNHRP
jgi:hypothetical protein